LNNPLVKHLVRLREDKDYRYRVKSTVVTHPTIVQELCRYCIAEIYPLFFFFFRLKQNFPLIHVNCRRITAKNLLVVQGSLNLFILN
jgi:hypothetical protein